LLDQTTTISLERNCLQPMEFGGDMSTKSVT
jgi:hypothetical protein